MEANQAAIPVELVAVITAALAAVLDRPVGSFVVTSIQPQGGVPALAAPSAWGKAGVLESHFTRRQFGLRTR